MHGRSVDPSSLMAFKKRQIMIAERRSKGTSYVQLENKEMGFDNIITLISKRGLDSGVTQGVTQGGVRVAPTVTFISSGRISVLSYTPGSYTISEYGFMEGTTKYPITDSTNSLDLTTYLFPTPPSLSATFSIKAYVVYDGITITSSPISVPLQITIDTPIIEDITSKLVSSYSGDYAAIDVGFSNETSIVSAGFPMSTFNLFADSAFGQVITPVNAYVTLNNGQKYFSSSITYDWTYFVNFTSSIDDVGNLNFQFNQNLVAPGDSSSIDGSFGSYTGASIDLTPVYGLVAQQVTGVVTINSVNFTSTSSTYDPAALLNMQVSNLNDVLTLTYNALGFNGLTAGFTLSNLNYIAQGSPFNMRTPAMVNPGDKVYPIVVDTNNNFIIDLNQEFTVPS